MPAAGYGTSTPGPQGPKGDTGAQGPQGNPGATGSTGATGAAGPSSKVSLGNITVTETAIVAISAGIRTLTFTGISGLLAGDDIVLFPINALPIGYAIHNSVATANGTLQVTLNAPLLAIGSSYSIVCKVVAIR